MSWRVMGVCGVNVVIHRQKSFTCELSLGVSCVMSQTGRRGQVSRCCASSVVSGNRRRSECLLVSARAMVMWGKLDVRCHVPGDLPMLIRIPSWRWSLPMQRLNSLTRVLQ